MRVAGNPLMAKYVLIGRARPHHKSLPLLLSTRDLRALGDVGWLVDAKVRAQILDQAVAVLRIDQGSPLGHFVDLLGPGGFAQTLLHNDARFMALRAGSRGLRLHGARRKLAVGLRPQPRHRDTDQESSGKNRRRHCRPKPRCPHPCFRFASRPHTSPPLAPSPGRSHYSGTRSGSTPVRPAARVPGCRSRATGARTPPTAEVSLDDRTTSTHTAPYLSRVLRRPKTKPRPQRLPLSPRPLLPPRHALYGNNTRLQGR